LHFRKANLKLEVAADARAASFWTWTRDSRGETTAAGIAIDISTSRPRCWSENGGTVVIGGMLHAKNQQ
jgi:type IV pilus assembly protein PilQ